MAICEKEIPGKFHGASGYAKTFVDVEKVK